MNFRVLLSTFILAGYGASYAAPLVLELPNKERFQETFNAYEKAALQQKNATFTKRIILIGSLVAIVGGVVWYSLLRPSGATSLGAMGSEGQAGRTGEGEIGTGKKDSGRTRSQSNGGQKGNGGTFVTQEQYDKDQKEKQSFKYLFDNGLKLIAVGAAVELVYTFATKGGLLGFNLLRDLWSGPSPIPHLLLLSHITRSSFHRFHNALIEINRQKPDSYLFAFYKKELEGAYKMFINSYEKLGAGVTYELKAQFPFQASELLDHIEKTFDISTYTAHLVENDINKQEWGGVSAASLEALTALEKNIKTSISYVSFLMPASVMPASLTPAGESNAQ